MARLWRDAAGVRVQVPDCGNAGCGFVGQVWTGPEGRLTEADLLQDDRRLRSDGVQVILSVSSMELHQQISVKRTGGAFLRDPQYQRNPGTCTFPPGYPGDGVAERMRLCR